VSKPIRTVWQFSIKFALRFMSQAVSNIVHVTSWLSRQGGGIPPVVWSLARQCRETGVECCVAGLGDQWSGQDIPDSVKVVTGASAGPVAFGFSPRLSTQLQGLVKRGSVVHSHGLWMHPGVIARKLALGVHCPFVITPHGMLEPWALNNSLWKKRMAAWLFENKNLRMASCLHALCDAEAENFRHYGLRNPIAVLPNGVDLNSLHPLPHRDAITERFPTIRNRRRLLFLSRLHPKKGLENLLEAWRRLAPDFQDWCLLIAGSGLPDYEQQLHVRVRELKMDTQVVFLGPVHGPDKLQALAAADLFVLPSFSEGFSMAVLEAAAAGLPVLLTRGCNFQELARVRGAIEVSPEEGEIATGLRRLLCLSDLERKAMGQAGRALVERSYTWPAISRQMLAVYEWLAGAGLPPEFVRLN
jgi:glycosyltransferase involved in cell wall biosynthesis